jgi:Zn finger protein HypA/HybF involved in hydrogenase expression
VIVGCPTCGAEVEFRYDDSFVRVCGHCRSAVVRTDRGVETLGRFADLIPIDSPLRLFAEGRYGSTGFLLIGMAQLRHAAGGVWQEWYAKLDGGQWAWISEAQGRLYFTLERPDVAAPPIAALAQLAPGARLALAGTTFTVAERGTATYVSALGEIPYRLVPNSSFQFVDLSDGRGGFATIDYGDGSEPPAVYIGAQVAPQALGLSGGEAAPVEAARPAQGARLACPNCNGALELRAPDHTLRVACPYCGSLVSVEGGTLSILARQAHKPQLRIALGSKGRFADGELTVIGHVGRSASVEGEWWPFEEYLLYAPGVGFRWLVCSDGHWSYVQPVEAGAVSAGHGARYGGVAFRQFQGATLRVDSVLGEFYWRVEAGEQVVSIDFIAPPAMLSREASRTEVTWSLSTYLTPQDVERAFGARLGLPAPQGIGPNQPYPGGVGRAIQLVLAVFCAVGIAKCASAPAAQKLRQDFTVPKQSATPRPAVDPTLGVVPSAEAPGSGAPAAESSEPQGAVMFSDKFQLDGGRNVALALDANVYNNWCYAAVDLVNEATGQVVSVDANLEYYAGVDDGESWSEGSHTTERVLAPVPSGDYVLRVEAQHGGSGDVHLSVVVRQGVFVGTWFWLGLGVLGVPFLLVGWHAARFRARRWQNSSLPRPGATGSVIGDDDDDD